MTSEIGNGKKYRPSRLRRLWRATAAFAKSYPTAFAVVVLLFGLVVLVGGAIADEEFEEFYAEYKFNRLSSAEHLRIALDACRSMQAGGICMNSNEAIRHLGKIPKDAAERSAADSLVLLMHTREQEFAERRHEAVAADQARRNRLLTQTIEESIEQEMRT